MVAKLITRMCNSAALVGSVLVFHSWVWSQSGATHAVAVRAKGGGGGGWTALATFMVLVGLWSFVARWSSRKKVEA